MGMPFNLANILYDLFIEIVMIIIVGIVVFIKRNWVNKKIHYFWYYVVNKRYAIKIQTNINFSEPSTKTFKELSWKNFENKCDFTLRDSVRGSESWLFRVVELLSLVELRIVNDPEYFSDDESLLFEVNSTFSVTANSDLEIGFRDINRIRVYPRIVKKCKEILIPQLYQNYITQSEVHIISYSGDSVNNEKRRNKELTSLFSIESDIRHLLIE